jgi:hypothetical protein
VGQNDFVRTQRRKKNDRLLEAAYTVGSELVMDGGICNL